MAYAVTRMLSEYRINHAPFHLYIYVKNLEWEEESWEGRRLYNLVTHTISFLLRTPKIRNSQSWLTTFWPNSREHALQYITSFRSESLNSAIF